MRPKGMILFALAAVGFLLLAASDVPDFWTRRYIQRESEKAKDSAYALSQAYTTAQLAAFSGSTPFFTTGVQFMDTLYCYSSDSTDTALIFWNDDTLWLSVNGGVIKISALSGFAAAELVDTLKDSVDFLLAKVDTLQDICDSLGSISGGGGDTIPKGFIGMWSGDTANIPAGWSLCDGDTFTVWAGDTIWEPDLRDRFIISCGKSFAVNDTGGVDSLAATGTTDAGSAHTHAIDGLAADSTVRYPGSGTKIYIPRLSVGVNLPTNSNEDAHTHTFTATKQRSLPPYYALYYIFKL